MNISAAPRGGRRAIVVASAGLALTACAVGPDFKPPEAPQVTDADRAYTPAPMPSQTASAPSPGGAPQRFLTGEDISALWWEAFRSEPLDQLIRSALKRSPTLAAAQAALREARASYEATAGSTLFPSVSGQLSATRQRASLTSFGLLGTAEFDLYNATVNVSYTIDAFGATRRELEGLRAAIDYQRYQVEAAYLSLTANLVTTAIQEASIRAQLQATQDVLDAQSQTLSIVEKQQSLGAVAYTAVITQRTQVAQTRALLPALEKSLAQTRHLLAVYAGRLPSEAGLPEFSLESLQLPHDLPVSLPSSLVRQRPDIRASEAQLQQANAQVGVATANLYPQITLSGSVGQQSVQTNDLFSNRNFTWSLGAALLQPIFQGGALRARKRAAIAAFEAAQAQYQQTVLNAFLDVADTLRALDIDADALRVQAQSESLARESLDLVTRQYALGAASYLQLLDSQRTYQQAKIGLVQAQAARYADTAALFQALGGGWWNRPPLPETTGHP
ncbi:efflux transporter outer membrane subunit [Steroidobacter cummioxidans]|uniref:efflux transporter outer membrane subunit n=1 Tax=Steroidobacter cummioxidans TaxID=1803913 RepID=UPI000E318F0F|nr:efflux transporter outer membrane subunit [Steroidobacter cummioxidans]